MIAVVARVPVDPDAPTARRWAAEELANPVYHQGRSLLSRVIDWFVDQLSGLHATGLPQPAAVAIVVGLVAALVAVAWWVAGPVRRNRRAPAARGVLAAGDRRTAAQLRAAADAAASRGDWSAAVVERFRAIVRSLEERAVLDELPGRTAHEAAGDAGARLAAVRTELATAAELFDDVAYGERAAGPSDDAALRDVDRLVAAARREPTARTAVAVPR